LAIYRIHRLREAARAQFRWAPHTAGLTAIKPKDYEPAGEIDASSPYLAWTALKNTEEPLQPGDVLESDDGSLRIYKFVGFEEAQWILPEIKTGEPAPGSAEAPPANV
jgi:hypothetical protein